MVKAFILSSQEPRAASTDLRLTLRSPNLMKVGWIMGRCGFEGSQSWATRKETLQTSGVAQSKGGRRGAMPQSWPDQPRLLSRIVEKYWSLDTFWEDRKGKEKWKLPESETLNGREVVGLLAGMERKRGRRRQVSQSAVQGTAASHYWLHKLGELWCLSSHSLSSTPISVINFKIYYGSCIKVTPCYFFYIFLTNFH